MTERKQMHLQDLFRTGRQVTFDLELEGEPIEISMWMRKPTAAQQDEALAKARGRQARRKKAYRDTDSDEYVAVLSDVESYETIDDIREQLLRFEGPQLRQQAFQEVLHDKELMPKDEDGEPLYGEDNTGYLDLLMAIQQRMGEINQFNEDLEEEDKEHLWKQYENDEELIGLQKDRDDFEKYVEAHYEVLAEKFMVAYKGKKLQELRKLLVKRMIDADVSLLWYEEYRIWMLYFACRDLTDRTKAYFSNPQELLEIPPAVLTYLENELDDLDRPGDAVKNLPSPRAS